MLCVVVVVVVLVVVAVVVVVGVVVVVVVVVVVERQKAAQNPQFFYTVDLEMCLAPQRRALFRRLNLSKWSEHGVLCRKQLQIAARS